MCTVQRGNTLSSLPLELLDPPAGFFGGIFDDVLERSGLVVL